MRVLGFVSYKGSNYQGWQKQNNVPTIQEELEKNRLFFLRFYANIHYDDQGKEQDYSKWQSIDRDLGISFDAGNFADRS